MYPGKGTVVLIRPAQTFYERIKIEIESVSSITFDEDSTGWTGYTDNLSINDLQMCCDIAIAAFERFPLASHT